MLTDKSTDIELWIAIKENQLKGFNILFDRYWCNVYSTAFYYLKDADACTEISHDIFLNIWNRRQALNIQSIKSYLVTSARYHVFKRKQGIRSIDLKYIQDYKSVDLQTVKNSGEESFNYQELEADINSFLEELPSRVREIFILSRREHLSNQEIASRLSISKRTVENQITNALKHLRMSLKHISIVIMLQILE